MAVAMDGETVEHSGVEVMVRDKMEDTVEAMEVALRDMEEVSDIN